MLADGYQACSLITVSEATGRSLNRVRVEIKPIYQSMKLRTGGGIDYAFAGIIISREHSVHSCIKYTVHYGAHGLAGNWGYCEQEKPYYALRIPALRVLDDGIFPSGDGPRD